MINISKTSGVISIRTVGSTPKSYFGEGGKYTFLSNNTTLQVYIGGDNYTAELGGFQINGQEPATLAEALVLLNAVFGS